jgi:hypothetical protein
MKFAALCCSVALVAMAPAAFAQTAPAPVASPTPAAPATPAAAATKFSLDTPVQDLMADPAAKVVIDKHIPGFTAHPQYEMAKTMSLNQIAPYAADTLPAELLAKIAADLAVIK